MKLRRLIPLLLSLLWMPALHAEYFEITHYSVNVRITEEGYADFDERIEVHFFEQRHGIYRNIPLVSVVNGKRVTRIIKHVSVEGFEYASSRDGNNYVLKIGDKDVYVDGNQTYRIRYRILNPLNFFDDHSEFYWDLLGTGWEVPVHQFSYLVEVPARIALHAEDVRIFTGAQGETGKEATLMLASENLVEGQTTRSFQPGEAVTIAMRLPGMAFEPMGAAEHLWRRHALLFAPFAFLFSGFFALFRARNRRQTIMTEFFPPKGVSPAVAGGFVDHSVDTNDILCMIPLLAERGYLKIETEEGGFWSKDKVYFIRLKDSPGQELAPFEAEFFEALFSYGDRVQLKSLKDKFYVHISTIRASVKKWIKDQGWYEASQHKLAIYTALGGLAALVWGILALSIWQNLDGFGLIIAGFILFFLAFRFNKRTPEGNAMYRHLEGFRQFVKQAEKPVIERLLRDDPHYYDKTMPYALAFGYLKRWNRQFEGLLSEPPSWYGGAYGTSAAMSSWNSFSESFPSEIDQIGSVFTSSPSSSSGGGGGSSGGGSGGGGGGSW